jgi:hypothetical protein
MFPPLSEQNCSNCRYSRTGWPGDLYCHRSPPQIGPRGEQWPQVDRSDWCGEWVAREGE